LCKQRAPHTPLQSAPSASACVSDTVRAGMCVRVRVYACGWAGYGGVPCELHL
jgi:hypothetical protein